MKVSETSIEALDKYKEYFGETQEGKVFEHIVRNPHITRNELSIETGIKLNAVCGRVNALIKKNIIKEGSKRLDKYNNTNVKSFTLYNKEFVDWDLLKLLEFKQIEKKKKDPLYKYAHVIRCLINNFEKNNEEGIKTLLSIDDQSVKDIFALKRIVNRIDKKYGE